MLLGHSNPAVNLTVHIAPKYLQSISVV